MNLNEIECSFQQYCFHFSFGTVGKLHHVCRKYSLRDFQTRHPKISSDRQGGELVWVKGINRESKRGHEISPEEWVELFESIFCETSYIEKLLLFFFSKNGTENGIDYSYNDTTDASECDVDLN